MGLLQKVISSHFLVRKLVYSDRDGILEHDPINGLLAPARGKRAVVVEVLVHQDGQEVHHVHV